MQKTSGEKHNTQQKIAIQASPSGLADSVKNIAASAVREAAKSEAEGTVGLSLSKAAEVPAPSDGAHGHGL